jgi:hypothetical protein
MSDVKYGAPPEGKTAKELAQLIVQEMQRIAETNYDIGWRHGKAQAELLAQIAVLRRENKILKRRLLDE